MAYAHSRGVLHRDLKPGNVMLGPYGETLVVDWGLAKPLGRRPSGPSRPGRPLTPDRAERFDRDGRVGVGTPAYMSPEQAAGRLDRSGPASDVYGLGATLYHLLTGQRAVRAAEDGEPMLRRSSGATSAAAAGRSGGRPRRWRRSASRRWPCSPRTATPRPAAWPTTSKRGWPTSRSRPGASRGECGCVDGSGIARR